MNDDDPYYRPFRRSDGTITICCVQWFDEFDYDQKRFLTDIKFASEEEATIWVEMYSRNDIKSKVQALLNDMRMLSDAGCERVITNSIIDRLGSILSENSITD